jgi:hypothetical protein
MKNIGKSRTTRFLLVVLLAMTAMGQKCYNVKTVRVWITKVGNDCKVAWLTPTTVTATKNDVVVWTFLNTCGSKVQPAIKFESTNPMGTCYLTVRVPIEDAEVGAIACVLLGTNVKREAQHRYDTVPSRITSGMPDVQEYP